MTDLLASAGLPYLALLVLLAVASAVLGGSRSRRRSWRASKRPFWKDIAGLAAGITVFWAIFVAPGLLREIDPSGELDPFASFLSFGSVAAWAATIGLWLLHRLREKHKFARVDTVRDLLRLPSDEFEHFVAHLFRSKGNTAKVMGGSGDHGVDILVESSDGERAIVQCKRWSGKWVDEGVIRDLYGAMTHDGPGTKGFLVTTSKFSEAGREWAKGKPITLIDGERLAQAILELRKTEQRN